MTTDYMIRELPEGESAPGAPAPAGGSSLADSELLAVLLRTGRGGASAIQMAMDVLRENGGLPGLLTATPHSLRRNGLGRPRRRRSSPPSSSVAASPASSSWTASRSPPRGRGALSRPPLPHLRPGGDGRALPRSPRPLLGEREMFRGTLSRISVEPREILRECLQRGAASIYLFHTHPSGDPAPSAEDLLFTRRMAEAAEIVGLRLADHVVLGHRGRWVSLREKARGSLAAAMATYHLDCGSGIAGDMFLGACLDLGMPARGPRRTCGPARPAGIGVEARKASRGGFAGTRFRVLVDGRPIEGPDPEEQRTARAPPPSCTHEHSSPRA